MSAAGPPQGASSAPSGGSERRGPRAGGDHIPAHFVLPLRVYYEDTDAGGVVYYANYLKFMERARTEWLESLGFPLAAFEREHGIAFVVHHADIEFLQPALLNDRLQVSVEALDRGASRLVVAQQVLRDDRTLARATIALACVDRTRWRPVRIPPPLARLLPRPSPAKPPS